MDMSSERVVFSPSHYSRAIQLQDGRVMAVSTSGVDIVASYSTDYGNTWSKQEVIARHGSIDYCTPDVIQLTDGTILVSFIHYPKEPYDPSRVWGNRCIRSTDGGKTWSKPIFIFDGEYVFENGCWEPCFLELPSGEIHCYFANESEFTTTREQCISICRSFDKGLTWGKPERVSFRSGARDGMPVPIITEAGEIVLFIEDNNYPGCKNFRVVNVRTTLEDNWYGGYVDGNSSRRNIIFEYESDKQYWSAGPYVRRLYTGEHVASWMGEHFNREGVGIDHFNMYVAVGDKDARNFKAVTPAFNLDLNDRASWGSVSALNDSSILVWGNTRYNNMGPQEGSMVKGYVRSFLSANYGTPSLDATQLSKDWTTKKANQVLIHRLSDNEVSADFLYDFDYLYFTARVIDRDIYTDKIDNDGVYLSFDTRNACDTYPQEGMYRFFFNTDGTMEMEYGSGNKWHDATTTEGIIYNINKKSYYYNIIVAIPWSMLGMDKAPQGKTMRINVENRDRDEGVIIGECIPDAIARESWTWMEFRLNTPEAVQKTTAERDDNQVRVTSGTGNINVYSQIPMASVMLYSIDGKLLNQAVDCGTYYYVPIYTKGCGILVVNLDNGQSITKKIIFN